MKAPLVFTSLSLLGGIGFTLAMGPAWAGEMPYKAAGLTERQAAAHLLDRFAYGARPGDVDRAVSMGLDRWLDAQLAGKLPDAELQPRLAPLKSLTLSSAEIAATFPQMNVLRNEAIREGIITQSEYARNPQEVRRKLRQYAREKGIRQPQELATELMAQKLLRAVYSENQLHEVLTDFWFNHFNVSLTDNQARPAILSYERDAIRPNVTGRFRDLLLATAKHPAMLQYLDNAQSNAPEGTPTLMQEAVQRNANAPRRNRLRPRRAGMQTSNANGAGEGMQPDGMPPGDTAVKPNPARPRPGQRNRRGINENYARELMELHTLGVDGGYTQKDVIEVARALTGWTVYPQGPRAEQLRRRIERQGDRLGFVHQGDFLFRPDTHDAGAKTILGAAFPAGGGLEEGEKVLEMLSRHPSAAKFISRKLAVRFVSDTPPNALVNRLTVTFEETDGDIKAMVRTLVESPEFWDKPARRSKVKSPFELVASSLRAVNAEVRPTRPLMQWVARMGQPLYAYQPPTGYPDRATAWVNTGSLLNRMNFGLQLAYGRIPGVRLDLPALNDGREPESAEAALLAYARLLMPERDLSETLKQLLPAVHDPQLAQKVDAAAPKPTAGEMEDPDDMEASAPPTISNPASRRAEGRRGTNANRPGRGAAPPPMLAQVVGVLLGSPEFQRR